MYIGKANLASKIVQPAHLQALVSWSHLSLFLIFFGTLLLVLRLIDDDEHKRSRVLFLYALQYAVPS
jgi:hypothetical protein